MNDETSSKKNIFDPAFLSFAIAYLLLFIPAGMIGAMKSEIAAGLAIPLQDFIDLISYGMYIFAASLIPASLLINRFSPGSLGWISILLCAIGLGIRGIAPNSATFLAGLVISNMGWAMAIPLIGQIARNRLDTKTFITATTTVFVLGQGTQALSLMVVDFIGHSISWRTLYLFSFLLIILPTFLVWKFVKPSSTFNSGSISNTIKTAFRLMKSPVLWLASLASALFLATLADFGFIWDINFQSALGWKHDYSVMLAFLFLFGIIAGGYGATIVARQIGGYATMLIGMSYGCIAFTVAILITPEHNNIWFVAPLLITMGMGFGSCSMILPYFAHFFEDQASGIFFAIGQTVNAIMIGILVSVPILRDKKSMTWSEMDGLDAMSPYLWTFITGLGLYIVLGILHKLTKSKEKISSAAQ